MDKVIKAINTKKRKAFREAIELGRRGEVICITDLVTRLVAIGVLKRRSQFFKYFPSGSSNYQTIKESVDTGKANIRLQIKALILESNNPANIQFLYKLYATKAEAEALQRFGTKGTKAENLKQTNEPPQIQIC